jgi:hypothetical protein
MAKAKKPAPRDRSGQFNVRLADGLRDRVAQVAADTGRSMNDVIVAAIEASLDHIAPKADLHDLAKNQEKLAIRLALLEQRVSALDGKGLEEGED